MDSNLDIKVCAARRKIFQIINKYPATAQDKKENIEWHDTKAEMLKKGRNIFF